MKKLIEKKLIFIFTCMDGQKLTWKDLKYIKDVKFKDVILSSLTMAVIL